MLQKVQYLHQNVSLHGGAIEILSCQPPPPPFQLDRTHAIAAHMGQGAPKDMPVTFVIGADEWQCHKNPHFHNNRRNQEIQEGGALQ